MQAHSPILMFDSGVGGLTVLAEVRRLLPDAPVIYAADIAGLPYGTKTEAEVAARVCGLLGRMAERWHPRLICIACNTASTIALSMVRDVLEVPIVGTVPAIKPAATLTKSGVIGLLGTEATVRQAYVDRLEAEFARGKLLLRQAAPGLVEAAERKIAGDGDVQASVDAAVGAMRALDGGSRIDTVVLACTHFPLLAEELRRALGKDVLLVDGAGGIARRIESLCEGQAFERTAADRFYYTGAQSPAPKARKFLRTFGLETCAPFS